MENSSFEKQTILIPKIQNQSRELFQDHSTKCRCCFKKITELISQENSIKSWHRRAFKALANVVMHADPDFSNHLCFNCIKLLEVFYEFRQTAAEVQENYYEFIGKIIETVETDDDEFESEEDEEFDENYNLSELEVSSSNEQFQVQEKFHQIISSDKDDQRHLRQTASEVQENDHEFIGKVDETIETVVIETDDDELENEENELDENLNYSEHKISSHREQSRVQKKFDKTFSPVKNDQHQLQLMAEPTVRYLQIHTEYI